jgi:digeranylgeranylglycerophospholipid reductase
MKSMKNKVYIKGNSGYIFTRGKHKNSIENQLYSESQVPINFDSCIRLKDIKGRFDHILVSTGDSSIAKELGIWTTTFCSHVRSAIIPGSFSSDSPMIWFNTDYSKNCFSSFLPNSPKDAILLLIANNTSCREMDFYWNQFMLKENIRYPVSQFNELEFNLGFPAYLYRDNIYFMGNAAGAIDSFIGFGAVNAIESGILAARSIIYSLDYNVLMEPIITSVKKLNKYRMAVDKFHNSDYDMIIKLLGSRFVKPFIYSNPLFKVKNFSFMPHIYSKIR